MNVNTASSQPLLPHGEEEPADIDALSKRNFNMKLRIFYLEKQLKVGHHFVFEPDPFDG